MASVPQHGDEVPEEVLQELIEAIEAPHRLFPRLVLQQATQYALQYLDMAYPTATALWDYILDRLQHVRPWRYAELDDYPDCLGYALRRADGRRLYIKLRFDDEAPANVVVMSFHE